MKETAHRLEIDHFHTYLRRFLVPQACEPEHPEPAALSSATALSTKSCNEYQDLNIESEEIEAKKRNTKEGREAVVETEVYSDTEIDGLIESVNILCDEVIAM
jgi:hypothetical protein